MPAHWPAGLSAAQVGSRKRGGGGQRGGGSAGSNSKLVGQVSVAAASMLAGDSQTPTQVNGGEHSGRWKEAAGGCSCFTGTKCGCLPSFSPLLGLKALLLKTRERRGGWQAAVFCPSKVRPPAGCPPFSSPLPARVLKGSPFRPGRGSRWVARRCWDEGRLPAVCPASLSSLRPRRRGEDGGSHAPVFLPWRGRAKLPPYRKNPGYEAGSVYYSYFS